MTLWSWVYDWPTMWSFILFVVIATFFAMAGLYIINLTDIDDIKCADNNAIVGIFIATVSIFLGVVLTFIIVEVWNNYDEALTDAEKEASTIVLLFQTVATMPGTEQIQELIIDYLEYIIEVEYPAMRQQEVPLGGDVLFRRIEIEILQYVPTTEQQSVLYNESIDLMIQAREYRTDRLNTATIGVNPLIWWIIIINSVLLLGMSWFLTCSNVIHYTLTAVAAIYVASPIFIMIILSYPFRGYAAIPPEPFEIALENIGILQ